MHLENKWVTQSSYFRLYTAMVGIYAIDTWKICKRLDKSPSTICQYSNMLTGDMMEYATNFTDDKND